jgi:hypothetical protein
MSNETPKTVKEAVDWLLHEERVDYIRFKLDKWTVDIWFDDADHNQQPIKQMLNEANHRGIPLVGTYSYQKHNSHGAAGQYHLHLYNRNNQIFAINKDGTAHDASHKAEIPNVVADALRQKFPDWTIPDNNIIEGANADWCWPINALLNG